MENKKGKFIQFLKKYWILVIFIIAYLIGDLYGFSGIESSLFGVAVLTLILIQRGENEREKLERRIDEIANKEA